MILDEDKNLDTGGASEKETFLERPERAERTTDRDTQTRESIKENKDVRSVIQRAIKEHSEPKVDAKDGKPRAEDGKFALKESPKEPVQASKDKPIPETPKGETAPVETVQPASTVAAPAALSKETRAVWDTLPDVVKNDIIKRETDTAKGVEQLKSRYKPYDDAFAPYQQQLQAIGKTPPEAVTHLLGWQAALADPRRQRDAFVALAKAHNFDVSTLVAPQGQQVADPNAPIDPSQIIRPFLDPLQQKVTNLESVLQHQENIRVANDIATLSKGKPHFDRVRFAMGHLMQAGLAQGDTPQEVFDDAYQRACRADPEVFGLIQQEADEKRESDAKAKAEAAAKKAAEDAEVQRKRDAEEVAKARKAGVNPRRGSPVELKIGANSKAKSVGDSLRDAMQEAGARV